MLEQNGTHSKYNRSSDGKYKKQDLAGDVWYAFEDSEQNKCPVIKHFWVRPVHTRDKVYRKQIPEIMKNSEWIKFWIHAAFWIGWFYWGLTSLWRSFSHISTWITNLWNRSGEAGNRTLDILLRKRRALPVNFTTSTPCSILERIWLSMYSSKRFIPLVLFCFIIYKTQKMVWLLYFL